MTRPGTRGFTLVEILVSLGIVAILAAVLVPVIQTSTARAQSAKCLSHLRALGTSLNLYLGENGMVMPVLAAARASKTEDVPVIDTVLAPYAGDPRVFACPAGMEIAKETGTSYFYNSALGGQPVASLNFLGVTDAQSRIPVLVDKEGWHIRNSTRVNHLFADGHAASEFRLFAE